MSTAAGLVEANADLWGRLATHPFVAAAASGELDPGVFDRWLVQDHYFVAGFRRFLARLVDLAPDEAARDLLVTGLGALTPELELFRREAAARGLDLSAEPCPTNAGYTAFVQAAPSEGFLTGLTVLYGAERAYFDAWSAVRAGAGTADTPYRAFVDNWSSPGFGAWVDDVGACLDRLAPAVAGAELARPFRLVVRFELRFWDAVYAGEEW